MEGDALVQLPQPPSTTRIKEGEKLTLYCMLFDAACAGLRLRFSIRNKQDLLNSVQVLLSLKMQNSFIFRRNVGDGERVHWRSKLWGRRVEDSLKVVLFCLF